MEIKLSKLKQIISEVVEERHASDRMDNIMQSTREEETVEEVDPHDQAIDDMIAEEMEEAMKKFIVGEDEGAEAPAIGVGGVETRTSDTKNLQTWMLKVNTLTEWGDFFQLLEAIFTNPKFKSHVKRFTDEATWDTREYQLLIQLIKALSINKETGAKEDAKARAKQNTPEDREQAVSSGEAGGHDPKAALLAAIEGV